MSHDPFYNSIVSALSEPLDHNLFELCACDLLEKDFPGIAPILGGKDAGMDGAVPDAEGEPYPLVCTTSKDGARNLRDNLRSYVKAGRLRRKVIFATSRFLQPREIQSLYDEARKLDFTLVQVFDGNAIALKLYHRPDWCQRLLGLTGNPPALSIFPKTQRPIIGEVAIGRSADIEWLRTIDSDRVLVGQPGSGKTFLLYLLAQGRWGLFAVSENCSELANGIRSEMPSVIIVDDAHVNMGLLETLVHLRWELGAKYYLLATCWPGRLMQTRSLLNANEDQIRMLKPLSRDSMVEVIKQVGLQGPTALIREIVTQSVGKPGLAVTMADLCLRGGKSAVRDLLAGEIITQQIQNFFMPIIGADVTEILASFAVGGKAGMRDDSVCQFLSIPSKDLRHRLAELRYGGVIQEHSDNRISVIPSALRYSLVKEVFFMKPAPLDLTQILPHVVSNEDAFQVLVEAKAFGANIDLAFLETLVCEIDTADAWESYSRLGPEQTREALEKRPQLLEKLARIGLFYIPEFTIQLLLNACGNDRLDLHALPEHPLRQLQDWIKNGLAGRSDAIKRRRATLNAIRNFIENGGNIRIAVHALSFVFNPHTEWAETDPGAGLTVTMYSGILTLAEIKELRGLWPEAKQILESIEIQGWHRLFEMLDNLMHPHIMGRKVPDDIYEECIKLSKMIIKDLANLAKAEVGVLAKLKQKALNINFNLNVRVERSYDILYSDLDIEKDWKDQQSKRKRDVESLAESWIGRQTSDVVGDIIRLEKASQVASQASWPRWPIYLCQILSKKTDNPSLWIDCLITRQASPDLVEQFLERCIDIEEPRCEEIISNCLSLPTYRGIGAYMALKMPKSNKDLIGLVWNRLGEYSQMLGTMIIRNEIPEGTLRLLLGHNDLEIIETTAVGIWDADRNHRIPDSLYDEWRNAVIRIRSKHSRLPEILLSDPTLAFDWLKSHLPAEDLALFRHYDAFNRIIASLTRAQKLDLLSSMQHTAAYRSSNIICALIENDVELYRILLSRNELSDYHLKPLETCTEDMLPQMVREAVIHYDIKKIARAIFGSACFWQGKASDYWKSRLERYERWKGHPDELVKQIAEELVEIARQNYQDALEKEHHEQVFGLDDD